MGKRRADGARSALASEVGARDLMVLEQEDGGLRWRLQREAAHDFLDGELPQARSLDRERFGDGGLVILTNLRTQHVQLVMSHPGCDALPWFWGRGAKYRLSGCALAGLRHHPRASK